MEYILGRSVALYPAYPLSWKNLERMVRGYQADLLYAAAEAYQNNHWENDIYSLNN